MKGITFGDVHSWYDLNLVLAPFTIPPAAVKTNFVDIPGGDGSVDLTEALGEPRYKDRTCKFTFSVLPEDDFEEKKTEVSNLLSGKRCKIILDKDPDYYWDGRCTIDEFSCDKNLKKIVVGAVVAPYKLKIAQSKVTIPAGENVTGILWNGRKTVVPIITATAEATIVFAGNTYTVNAGTHKLLNIELHEDLNQITVTSAEPVVFVYQEGDL